MAVDDTLGFHSLTEAHELTDHELPVEGTLPDWLEGTLFRNGPAKFGTDGERVEHWFDGLAMIHQYEFSGNSVAYTGRFLRTQAYRDMKSTGTIGATGFAMAPSSTLIEGLRERLFPSITDNTNVNVTRLADRFVALTEVPNQVVFDPQTLRTIESFEYTDDLAGQLSTGHPHHDEKRGETVNFLTKFGRRHAYKIYRVSDGASTRKLIGTIETSEPAYMHSFGLTENHVVLTEIPFVVKPWRFFLPTTASFIDAYQWKPDRGTRFHVMDRDTGKIVARRQVPAFFMFHHVNAFERDEEVVIDLVGYPDPSVIDSMFMADLDSGFEVRMGDLRRYHIPLDIDPSRVEHSTSRETLYSGGIELPRINPTVARNDYRYAYGQGNEEVARELPDRLVKVDVTDKSSSHWHEPEAYVGEPVFVPAPDREHEDEGVVLASVLDFNSERTALVVLDGQSFEERARAELPHALPFDFHGQFFHSVSTDTPSK